MTEKTIKAFGVGTMWVEVDGPIEEDNFLPIARIIGWIALWILAGIAVLSFVLII